jgi:hypothetical protein
MAKDASVSVRTPEAESVSLMGAQSQWTDLVRGEPVLLLADALHRGDGRFQSRLVSN